MKGTSGAMPASAITFASFRLDLRGGRLLRGAEPIPLRPKTWSVLRYLAERPVWKAFVLQFSRETGTQAAIFSGRVEHLSSGRRARFASREELLPVLSKMLDDLGENGT